MNFTDLHLNSTLVEGLDAMGITRPTEIQQKAIPQILNGQDLIGCAQTGTGKTAAFLLPAIHNIMQAKGSEHDTSIKMLVIVPTRELALQIDQVLEGLCYFTDISSYSVYGGGDGSGFDAQKKALSSGTDVIIATPGKLISHLNMGYVKIDNLKYLVLDEADRMLDMGFYEDLMRIVSFLPKNRQTLMFSATMPPRIRQLAKNILSNPTEINIAISKPAAGVLQVAYLVYDKFKIALLTKLLSGRDLNGVIIFSSTKRNVKDIARDLRRNKLQVAEIHSDLTQEEREEVMRRFKNRQTQILVATDIVARGIDIAELQLVVNFDAPGDAEDYVHRVGRTARADNTGMAITFIDPKDMGKFSRIEQLIEQNVLKQPTPPEIGESPEYKPRSSERSNKSRKPGKKSFRPKNKNRS